MKKSRFLFFFFFCIPFFISAQNVVVTGTVSDRTGETIIGASVVEQGTQNGTATDVDGKFSISVPRNATLQFSYIGYTSHTVALRNVSGARHTLNVVLDEDTQTLDEVVVIGYGTQRKEAITGSVASVRGDIMRDVASTNISNSLQGRVAGVEMTQSSTKPGAAMDIRILGVRSLTASNSPLIVLDGIPFAGSINDIDPNSIKSLDILKDASATAIYGSRGANGAVLVTTNRGFTGQQAEVSYNGYYGFKNVFSQYPMMDGPEYARLRKEVARTVDELGKGTKYPNSADEDDNTNTNWQDLLYRTGTVSSHDISVSKGFQDGNYNAGIGYYKDEAVLPTSQYSRLSLRIALDQNIGKYLRFGLSTNSSYGFTEGSQVGVADALGNSPLASPYDANGNLKRATFASQDPYKVWTKEAIEAVKNEWLSESKTLGSYNNIYGEIKAPWVEGLKYRINVGLNIRTTTGGGFTGIGTTNATDPNAQSSASINNGVMTNWAIENLVSYDKTFNEKHSVNAVALYSAEETKYNTSNISVRNLPADHFQYYNLGQAEGEITINPSNQTYEMSGLMSWMGRVMYSYDDKYMISATLRSDGSSRLAPGHKWHTYPALSAGWNIKQEEFMAGLSFINSLKLRAGYGETSNQAIPPYKTLGLLNTRPYNFNDNFLTGYYISELPNINLGWEYTTTWNYGVDFSLFKDRLTGTIEYYTHHTKDILLRVNLPSTAGVPSYMSNIGETQNKGMEISLNGKIINNLNGWSWDAGINWYTNRNELLQLNSGQDRDEGNWWFVGYPINVIYDYEKIGLWQEGDPHLEILEPGGNVGMIKVKYTGEYDAAGVPVRKIDTDDRQIIKLDPDFQGGFNTRVAYKGLDLNVVGGFKSGGILISSLYGGSSYLNQLSGRHGNVSVDYYTPENTGAKYPRPGGLGTNDNPKYANSLALFDASYVKIRVMTLGYNFTQRWLKDLGVSRLRLYATVQNPFVLFSPYNNETGMDPESNSYGNENQAVTGQFQSRLTIIGYSTPTTRNYLFGINLTF